MSVSFASQASSAARDAGTPSSSRSRCGGVRCRLHRLSFSFSYTPNRCRPHKAQFNTAYFIISAAHSDKQSALHSHSVDTQVKVKSGSRSRGSAPVRSVPILLSSACCPSGVRGCPPSVVRSAPRRQCRGRCSAVLANLPTHHTLLWLRTI